MRAIVLTLAACLTLGSMAVAQAIQAGDQFVITRSIESSSSTPDGTSTGSSTDRDTIRARVIGAGAQGLELEYDLPSGTTADDRARQWQLPARVLKPPRGLARLLDRSELEGRARAWLKSAGLTEAACGHWYFTWNAFQIECDPQSVIGIVEGFDLGPDDLADGTPYQDPKALNPVPVKRAAASLEGAVFHVTMAVDPDAVRRDLAEADVVAGEILRKPVTLKDALVARSAEQISGTIDIIFETDAAGHVRRQTKVTTLENIKGAFNGQSETRTSTETLERRLISDPKCLSLWSDHSTRRVHGCYPPSLPLSNVRSPTAAVYRCWRRDGSSIGREGIVKPNAPGLAGPPPGSDFGQRHRLLRQAGGERGNRGGLLSPEYPNRT